ncbi:hypothetical protein Ancab_001898, partial [Ancistrocladus abbreviatus]
MAENTVYRIENHGRRTTKESITISSALQKAKNTISSPAQKWRGGNFRRRKITAFKVSTISKLAAKEAWWHRI